MKILKTKSLSTNAISNWLALGVNVILSFVLTPILISKLGDENFGIWALVSSIIGMYGLMDLGIDSAILRYVSFYSGKEDKKSVDQVLNTSLITYIIIGSVILLLTFLSLDFLARFFNVSNNNINNFKYTLIFIGSSIAVTFPTNVFRTSLLSHEFYVINNIIRITSEVLRVSTILVVLNIGYGIKEVASITLFISILNFLVYIIICTLTSTIHLNLFLFSSKMLKKILLFGFPAMVTILAHLLRVQMDSIVIAKWMDFSSVTLYNISVKLTMFLTQFIMAISAVLDPRFGSLFGKKNYEEIKKIFYESSVIITFLTFSVGFSLLIFGKSLLNLWVGPAYLESYVILVILTIGQMLTCIQMPLISLLFALNNHRIVALISIIEGILNLSLSILFVQYFGVKGVALGTLIPIILRLPFLFVYIIKNCSYLMIDKKIILLIGKPIINISIISTVLIYFSNKLIINSWILLAIAFGCIEIFLLFITYFSAISNEHKKTFNIFLNSFIQKFK